ncbi:hypothetical protein BJF90_34555 [Pseudonocardia sp. CNS-004]|nr:hypothetical protein BJF90_34555 [Pseudonocardia sp. CNS-004]
MMIRSLREGIDYSTPTGRMVAGIFASLAEYEHTLINERAESARVTAPSPLPGHERNRSPRSRSSTSPRTCSSGRASSTRPVHDAVELEFRASA